MDLYLPNSKNSYIFIYVFIFCSYSLALKSQQLEFLESSIENDQIWDVREVGEVVYYIHTEYEDVLRKTMFKRINAVNEKEILIDFNNLDNATHTIRPYSILSYADTMRLVSIKKNKNNDWIGIDLVNYPTKSNSSYSVLPLLPEMPVFNDLSTTANSKNIWVATKPSILSGSTFIYKNNLQSGLLVDSTELKNFRMIQPNLYINQKEEIFMLGHWGNYAKLDSSLNVVFKGRVSQYKKRETLNFFRSSEQIYSNNIYSACKYTRYLDESTSLPAIGIFKFSMEKDTTEIIFEEIDEEGMGFTESIFGFDNVKDTLFYMAVNLKPCPFHFTVDSVNCTNKIALYSINGEGELNWVKVIGGDAAYFAFHAVALNNGGCLLTVDGYNYADDSQKIDAYYIKFDIDGNIENDLLSSIETEQPFLEVSSFLIYPNPASDLINIKFVKKEKTFIEIFDMNGALILDEILSEKNQIDIQCLPSGIYNCRVKTNKEVLGLQRFVKK